MKEISACQIQTLIKRQMLIFEILGFLHKTKTLLVLLTEGGFSSSSVCSMVMVVSNPQTFSSWSSPGLVRAGRTVYRLKQEDTLNQPLSRADDL